MLNHPKTQNRPLVPSGPKIWWEMFSRWSLDTIWLWQGAQPQTYTCDIMAVPFLGNTLFTKRNDILPKNKCNPKNLSFFWRRVYFVRYDTNAQALILSHWEQTERWKVAHRCTPCNLHRWDKIAKVLGVLRSKKVLIHSLIWYDIETMQFDTATLAQVQYPTP